MICKIRSTLVLGISILMMKIMSIQIIMRSIIRWEVSAIELSLSSTRICYRMSLFASPWRWWLVGIMLWVRAHYTYLSLSLTLYQQRIQSRMFWCFTLKADSESTEYKKMAQILTDITESAYVDIRGQELATILDFR